MSSDAETQSTARKALEDTRALSELLEGVLSKDETVRFGSFNALLLISEEHPEVLYPEWDFFSGLLSSKNTYHKYIAIYIIANLTRIDRESRFEKIYDSYFGLLNDKSVIPATHAAINAGKIVMAKPGLRRRITDELLNIKKGPEATSRNRNIYLVIAGAIEAFDTYFAEADDQAKIIEYVTQQLDSQSPKTRKAAREFLKKWE